VSVYRAGKRVQLCDAHLNALYSEAKKTSRQAEETLKLKPIETGGRMASFDEEDIYCCAPDCRKGVALFYGTKPVCYEHAKVHESLAFDGEYRRRKIFVIEKPHRPVRTIEDKIADLAPTPDVLPDELPETIYEVNAAPVEEALVLQGEEEVQSFEPNNLLDRLKAGEFDLGE
jgi:hypothetical protein